MSVMTSKNSVLSLPFGMLTAVFGRMYQAVSQDIRPKSLLVG